LYKILETVLIVLLFCSSIIIFTYAFRSLFFIFTTKIFRENSIIKNKPKEAEENKSIYSKENFIDTLYSDFFPFISILIAAYNENVIIERLLSSLSKLSYKYDKFETIIIDDSDNEETVDILKKWQKILPNLKVFHRQNRAGWKGGALNFGLNNLNKVSKIVLVVDADNVLEEDTLEKIAKYVREIKEKEYSPYVLQGYPKSLTMHNKKTSFSITQSKKDGSKIDSIVYNKDNWVSRGISFRLYQRNTIEFAAKEKLMLPLQITGSLFAVSTSILRSIRFSEDICEDWNLTLDIYLSKVIFNPLISVENSASNFNKIRKINYYKINSNSSNSKINNNINKKERIQKIILFKPELVSYTEITNNIIPYFRQRIRVSEGHTRGFRKKIIKILENERLSFLSKIELFFIGFRYVKYIPLMFLIISDFFFLLIYQSIDNIITNDILKMSIGLQCISLIIYIFHSFFSLKINVKTNRKEFTFKDVFYLLLLNICTIPAFVIGSFLGFIRSKGNFYRTKRNE
jgi:cellulose synthase/poly-beta-1,6-N-acetylglucosamine synthase-like glycosyltransferase